jgi:hypothetical protein
MKHLGTLGLAAMAALALTAMVGVSSASATEFHATGGTTLRGVVGENPPSLNIEGTTVTCNTIAFSGTAPESGTSATQEMHPTYSNCTAFGIISAVINTHNCEYKFNANTNTAALKSCPRGTAIFIAANSGLGNCNVEVAENSTNNAAINQAIGGQTFINMGTTGSNTATLTLNVNATNIVADVLENTGICPINSGVKNNVETAGNFGIMGATGGTSF